MSATASALLSELEDLRKVLDSRSPLRASIPGSTQSHATSHTRGTGPGSPRSLQYHAPVLGARPSPSTVSGGHEFDPSSAASGAYLGGRTGSPSKLHTHRYNLNPGEEAVAQAHPPVSNYATALSDAEANVDRLSRAMEAAEEEMENTFKRTTELHRSTAERREQEILELRKILATKERCIDGLRETLTTTKRALEARAVQAETSLAERESEVERLLVEVKHLREANVSSKGELTSLMGAKQSLELQIEQEVATTRHRMDTLEKSEAILREREKQLEAHIRKLTTEYSNYKANFEVETAKRAALQEETETLRRELAVCVERIQNEQHLRHNAEKQIEIERKKRKEVRRQKEELLRHRDVGSDTRVRMMEMEKQLRDERRSRLGAEKWLQAELKSKEEMENMFCSLRDIAINKEKETQLHDIKKAVVDLQQNQHETERERILRLQRTEFDITRASLERENERLKEDLRGAQREINSRLYMPPTVDRDSHGDLHARCRRCHERFNLSKPTENSCGYHPGELTPRGFTCCGVVPKPGSAPVYCHWRPHIA